jgi:spermidine synthase
MPSAVSEAERAVPDPARRVATAPGDVVFALALACFFLSGFAALLYQTVWTRQFAFVFGTADLAVATVLAAYMGGLALGAAVAARWAMVTPRPLLAYGVLELVIAVSALLVPIAIRSSTALAVLLFGSGDAPPSATGSALAVFYLGAAFVILLVPTTCMGATLPLLARVSVRRDEEVGGRVGTLYAVNTAGAVAGTVVAAFVLLPSFGLTRTVLVGVAVNAVVCLLAALVARRGDVTARVPAASAPVDGSARLVLVLLLASGITSFTYEVVWTRLLSHILGGSTYAFATMLATFLAGIALGAAGAARLATTPARALNGFALAELAIAAGAYAAFRGMDQLPALALRLGAGREPTQLGNAALAAIVMFPATVAIGATFPFAVRALAHGREDAAPVSARAYAWNTVGAIVGALGAGFFLMPWLGYAGVVTAAVGCNLAIAFATAVGTAPRALPLAALAATGGLGLVLAPPPTPWALIGTSPLSLGRAPRTAEFFAVGRSAGVTVGLEGGIFKLRTNGLPEGVMLPPRRYRRALPDRWLGALPILARPEARSMLVVGLGAGTALEAIPERFPDLDVIELEPRVIEANARYRARRAIDPLGLPGLHLHVNDARGALALTTKRYDIVVSQPSHPWTAGASHLYTREFFATVRDHLTPTGVFVQWIDLEIVDRSLLSSLLATLGDAFPNVRVYRPFFRGTALFLASAAALDVETHAARAVAAAPNELARAGILTAEDVAAALALDEAGVRAIAAGAPLTTDDRNLLESRTIRVATPLGYRGADELFGPLDPLPALLGKLDRLYLVRRVLADWDFPRAARLVAALGDPVEQATAAGILELATERVDEGRARLRAALATDPAAYEARIALLRAERAALRAGATAAVALAADLPERTRAVIQGWTFEDRREWEPLRALERQLATVAADDACYGDALRLRAAWRIASADPALAVDAMALLDRVLPLSLDPHDYLRRSKAAAVAGSLDIALESLMQALDSTTPGAYSAIATAVATALASLPIGSELADERADLERKIAVMRR